VEHRNHALSQVIDIIKDNPSKYTYDDIAGLSGCSYDSVTAGVRRHNKQAGNVPLIVRSGREKPPVYKRREEYIPPPPNTENVLVIGDIHAPFTLEGYREFCQETAKKYKITHVIFIGDVIDNHFASFHTHSADGMGGGAELDAAIEQIAEWVKIFPRADVVLGNHDRLIMRKTFEGSIPRRWIMNFQDVLGAPGWNFKEDFYYENIHYTHGEGGTARTRAKKDLCSTVQGHLHSQAYTEYIIGQSFKIFGMQVGCGVDRHSYAMAYAKDHPKPAIGVGVILDHGRLPFNVLMQL